MLFTLYVCRELLFITLKTKVGKPVKIAACGVITWATKACSRQKGCSSSSSSSIVGCWQEAGWLLARPSPLSAAQCCSTAHNTSTGLAGSVSPTKGLGACHANCHFLSRSAQSAGGVNPGVIQLGTKGSPRGVYSSLFRYNHTDKKLPFLADFIKN